jgi:hypothetical protein
MRPDWLSGKGKEDEEMTREEVYQATKKVFGLYGALFNLVAREVGMEKALALHVEAHERLGITAES